jgi:hypothetical protein
VGTLEQEPQKKTLLTSAQRQQRFFLPLLELRAGEVVRWAEVLDDC